MDRKRAKYESSKEQKLPAKFRLGFLQSLDNRTALAAALRQNYEAIVADIGGLDDIAHTKRALIERFVYLEGVCQSLESELLQEDANRAEILGRWVQAVNALIGLSKTIGLERRAIAAPWVGAAR